MTRLAQYSPKLTRSLIADLSDRRWKEFAPDFAHIILTPNERLEQTLRAIAIDTSLPERERSEVIEILGKISPVDRNELVSFLVDFSRNFKTAPNLTTKTLSKSTRSKHSSISARSRRAGASSRVLFNKKEAGAIIFFLTSRCNASLLIPL